MRNFISKIFSPLKLTTYVFLALSLFALTLPLMAENTPDKTPTEEPSTEETSSENEDLEDGNSDGTNIEKDSPTPSPDPSTKPTSNNNNPINLLGQGAFQQLSSMLGQRLQQFLSTTSSRLKSGKFDNNMKFRELQLGGIKNSQRSKEKLEDIDSWFFGVNEVEAARNNTADLIEMITHISDCGGIPVVAGLCNKCPIYPVFLPDPVTGPGPVSKPRYSYYVPFHKVEATEYMAHTGYESEKYIEHAINKWKILREDVIDLLRIITNQVREQAMIDQTCNGNGCRIVINGDELNSEAASNAGDLAKIGNGNSEAYGKNIYTRVFPTGFHEFFTNHKGQQKPNWLKDTPTTREARRQLGVTTDSDIINKAHANGVPKAISDLMDKFKTSSLINAVQNVFDEQWGHDGANYAERMVQCWKVGKVKCNSAKSNRVGLVDGHGLFYESYGTMDELGNEFFNKSDDKVKYVNDVLTVRKGVTPVTRFKYSPEIEEYTKNTIVGEKNEKAEPCTQCKDMVQGMLCDVCFHKKGDTSGSVNAQAVGPLVSYIRTYDHLEAAFKATHRAMVWATGITDSDSPGDLGSATDDCGPVDPLTGRIGSTKRKIQHPFIYRDVNKSDELYIREDPHRKRSVLQILTKNSDRYESIKGCSRFLKENEFVPQKTITEYWKGSHNSYTSDLALFKGLNQGENHGRTTVIAIWNFLENCSNYESRNLVRYFTYDKNGIWY